MGQLLKFHNVEAHSTTAALSSAPERKRLEK